MCKHEAISQTKQQRPKLCRFVRLGSTKRIFVTENRVFLHFPFSSHQKLQGENFPNQRTKRTKAEGKYLCLTVQFAEFRAVTFTQLFFTFPYSSLLTTNWPLLLVSPKIFSSGVRSRQVRCVPMASKADNEAVSVLLLFSKSFLRFRRRQNTSTLSKLFSGLLVTAPFILQWSLIFVCLGRYLLCVEEWRQGHNITFVFSLIWFRMNFAMFCLFIYIWAELRSGRISGALTYRRTETKASQQYLILLSERA